MVLACWSQRLDALRRPHEASLVGFRSALLSGGPRFPSVLPLLGGLGTRPDFYQDIDAEESDVFLVSAEALVGFLLASRLGRRFSTVAVLGFKTSARREELTWWGGDKTQNFILPLPLPSPEAIEEQKRCSAVVVQWYCTDWRAYIIRTYSSWRSSRSVAIRAKRGGPPSGQVGGILPRASLKGVLAILMCWIY